MADISASQPPGPAIRQATLQGPVDLHRRWSGSYSRMGVWKWRQREDFPQPALIVNAGQTPLWHEEDIAAYEIKYPELLDAKVKKAKVRSFVRAHLKKQGRL